MKKCPFCGEEIQLEAVKCRYCAEFLDDSYIPKPRVKWYYSVTAIVISLITIGPFALPLVWKHPKYKPATKAVITIIVIAVTVLLCWLVADLGRQIIEAYQKIMQEVSSMGVN